MSETDESYYCYWGKANPRDRSKNEQDYHLLVYHCLDVAAVGDHLIKLSKNSMQHIAELLNMCIHSLRRLLVFLLALHDIGKFSRTFQGLFAIVGAPLVKAIQGVGYHERHDRLGFLLWCKYLSKSEAILARIITGDSARHARSIVKGLKPWMEIMTGHHGQPPKPVGQLPVSSFFHPTDCHAVVQYIIDIATLILKPDDLAILRDSSVRRKLKAVSWQLAGMTVLADWIGSNKAFFPYQTATKPLDIYYAEALIMAKDAIAAIGLEASPASKFHDIDSLFSYIKTPTPLQQHAATVKIDTTPHLFILEDVTGAGKTEAAMILAHRLMNRGLAKGLFVGLPTMATANAMYGRLSNAYRSLFSKNATPSLVLAHGSRDMDDRFRDSVTIPEQMPDMDYRSGEPSASAYCNAWLADNRKKSLLAEVGVGTVDQALLGVLPARHQSLRLLGLRGKILVVDEVHAYDPYMEALLSILLEYHAGQGGSAILLSATLPRTTRQIYVDAFAAGLGQNNVHLHKTDYPLVTSLASVPDEKHIDTRPEVKRGVKIKWLRTENQTIEQIRRLAGKGHCVCWIRNTVSDAEETYRRLQATEGLDHNRLMLFHSRFALCDRQTIETDVLQKFGPRSTTEDRRGMILIATQVIEQSLDVDFDHLITDLAPIDLIIQRSGRLMRHLRDARGDRLPEGATEGRPSPVLHILSPPVDQEIDENWLSRILPGTQSVYVDLGNLWNTARVLFNMGRFHMPEDARQMIESVYGPEAGDNIPEPILRQTDDASVERGCKKSMAGLNSLKLHRGYTWSSSDIDGWSDDVHIPTRLGSDSVAVALVTLQEDQLQPYAPIKTFPWEMSSLQIPPTDWEVAKTYIPERLRSKIDELMQQVPALKWKQVFPLVSETEDFYSACNGWRVSKGGKR